MKKYTVNNDSNDCIRIENKINLVVINFWYT